MTVSTPTIDDTSIAATPSNAPTDVAPLVKAVVTFTAIIGGVVGGVIAFLCLSFIICYLCVIRCRRAHEFERAPRVSETIAPPLPPTVAPPSFFYIPVVPSYPAMALPTTSADVQPIATVSSFVTASNGQRLHSEVMTT